MTMEVGNVVSTGVAITPDELLMLTELKKNYVVKLGEANSAEAVLKYAIEQINNKYGLTDRQVIDEDGNIVELSEEIYNQLPR